MRARHAAGKRGECLADSVLVIEIAPTGNSTGLLCPCDFAQAGCIAKYATQVWATLGAFLHSDPGFVQDKFRNLSGHVIEETNGRYDVRFGNKQTLAATWPSRRTDMRRSLNSERI